MVDPRPPKARTRVVSILEISFICLSPVEEVDQAPTERGEVRLIKTNLAPVQIYYRLCISFLHVTKWCTISYINSISLRLGDIYVNIVCSMI